MEFPAKLSILGGHRWEECELQCLLGMLRGYPAMNTNIVSFVCY